MQMDERKNKRGEAVTENKTASEGGWQRKIRGEKAARRKEVTGKKERNYCLHQPVKSPAHIDLDL